MAMRSLKNFPVYFVGCRINERTFYWCPAKGRCSTRCHMMAVYVVLENHRRKCVTRKPGKVSRHLILQISTNGTAGQPYYA